MCCFAAFMIHCVMKLLLLMTVCHHWMISQPQANLSSVLPTKRRVQPLPPVSKAAAVLAAVDAIVGGASVEEIVAGGEVEKVLRRAQGQKAAAPRRSRKQAPPVFHRTPLQASQRGAAQLRNACAGRFRLDHCSSNCNRVGLVACRCRQLEQLAGLGGWRRAVNSRQKAGAPQRSRCPCCRPRRRASPTLRAAAAAGTASSQP